MEIIKRKILLEDIISRKSNGTYGTMTGDSFYVKIMLTQNADDMGVFNSLQHISTTQTEFPTKDNDMGTRYIYDTLDRYKSPEFKLTGLTEDRLDEVKNYNESELYKEDFDIKREEYQNYKDETVDGIDRVSKFGEPIEYVIGADDNGSIGSLNQDDGFFFRTYSGVSRSVSINNEFRTIPKTEIIYNTQGWNDTNVGLSALTKEEYLFGITSEPKVFSDVFIDRSIVSPIERHLKLSEVKSLNNLINYGNGFFNVKK